MAFGLRRSPIVTLGIRPDAPESEPAKKPSSWRAFLPAAMTPSSSEGGARFLSHRDRKKATGGSAEEWGPGPWPPVIPPDDPREATSKPATGAAPSAAPSRPTNQGGPFPRLVEPPPAKVSE